MFIVRFRLMKKRKKKQNPLIYIRTGVRIRSIAGYVHSRARASSNVIFLSSRIFCIICPLATFAYMLHTYIHTHTHTYIHTPVQHTYTHTHSYIQTDILNVRFLAARATSNRATKKRNTREKRKKEREEKKEKEKGNEREARFR